MFNDLYKGHNFVVIKQHKDAKDIFNYNLHFTFSIFHIYFCKTCKIIIAIIHAGIMDSELQTTTCIGNCNTDNWENVSSNISKILSCDENTIKKIIE